MAAKILVVDDYTTTRNALSISLRQEGYRVVAVVNGTEAVNRLAIESFDLVLTDFSMPGMDGLALTRHISRFAPQIPVILMSGSIEISRQDAVNAGAFDLVEKPFEIHSLIAKIELAFAVGASSSTAQPSFDKTPQFIS